ncbi:MAG: biotin--[acetyl-CoA-carboxylase] ligase [Thermoanaerobaculia bacterium]
MSFADYRAALARQRVDENLVALATVDSTNRFARTLVDRLGAGCPPTTVLAWAQRAGRGRLGRSWSSPAGRGVYASLVRRVASEELLAVPLLTGVGLATGIERVTGVGCRLKWPNDVLVGGRKLAGVLVESVGASRGRAASVVIGFGVNIAHDRSQLPGADATSIELETGSSIALAPLVAALVAAVDDELRRAGEEGYAVARFSELMAHRIGERLTCRLAGGSVSGELAGFERRGLLRLVVAGEERWLAAAELEGTAGEGLAC